jgi:hypothetical protein
LQAILEPISVSVAGAIAYTATITTSIPAPITTTIPVTATRSVNHCIPVKACSNQWH